MGYSVSSSLMAIVPMKPFAEAKRRLAVVLEGTAREELSRELLVRTIQVLKRSGSVKRVAVVSRDRQVLRLARKLGAWAMLEVKPGLNEALEQATRVARANGVQAALIVPADLPGLDESDVESIAALGRTPPAVVIAPARRDQGTNALLVNPLGLITYAFGESSFLEHQRNAARAGARVEIYRSESVAFDLDLPEDAKTLKEWNLQLC